MDEIRRTRIDGASLVWGIALIGFGALALLDRFHIGRFDDLIHDYWPMIFPIIGLAKLLRGNVWGGLCFIAIGSWLQIAHLRLFGLTVNSSWPLVLVIVGGVMILRALVDRPEERHG